MVGGELALQGVARTASRSVTDKVFYAIFTACNILLLVLLFLGYSKGDIKKITQGTDYNGNVCGLGYPANLTISQEEWATRTLLWYPFSYDTVTKEFRIVSAIKFGVCVAECNPVSGEVATYGGLSGASDSQTFKVMLKSAETFNRCIPDFKSFVCPSGNCTVDAEKSNGKAISEMGVTGFVFGLIQQVYRSLWVTLCFFLAAVLLCFVWIIFLRRAVKPVVVSALALLFVAGIGVTVAFFARHKSLQNSPETEGSDSAKLAFAGGIVSAILVLLYVCVMVYLRKSIMMSCDVITEGTRIIAETPTVMLVPVATSVLVFGGVVLFATVAALLYTVGTNETRTTMVENIFGQMVPAKTHAYRRPGWVDAGQVFNFFMMLWTLAFHNGVAYMTISLAGSSWFFSAPGDEKDTTGRVAESYITVARYHPGTVAFGTLLFAIMGMLRAIMNALEKRLRDTSGANAACCLFLCCANCCLSCLDRIVRFLTEHGFVMSALTGTSLIGGAREAVRLLATNPAVLTINVVSDVLLSVSRILIVVIVTFCGVVALDARQKADSGVISGVSVLACAILLGVGTWYIAGTFTRVMTVCIDTTLLCFCYDLDKNNGADRPYYAPQSLQQHITTANARDAEKRRKKGKDVEEGLLNNRRH